MEKIKSCDFLEFYRVTLYYRVKDGDEEAGFFLPGCLFAASMNCCRVFASSKSPQDLAFLPLAPYLVSLTLTRRKCFHWISTSCCRVSSSSNLPRSHLLASASEFPCFPMILTFKKLSPHLFFFEPLKDLVSTCPNSNDKDHLVGRTTTYSSS